MLRWNHLGETEILLAALNKWGIDAQINMCIEEMAELTQALNKYRRGKWSRERVVEELADVDIALRQMIIVFGQGFIEKREQKLQRLAKKVGVKATGSKVKEAEVD